MWVLLDLDSKSEKSFQWSYIWTMNINHSFWEQVIMFNILFRIPPCIMKGFLCNNWTREHQLFIYMEVWKQREMYCLLNSLEITRRTRRIRWDFAVYSAYTSYVEKLKSQFASILRCHFLHRESQDLCRSWWKQAPYWVFS